MENALSYLYFKLVNSKPLLHNKNTISAGERAKSGVEPHNPARQFDKKSMCRECYQLKHKQTIVQALHHDYYAQTNYPLYKSEKVAMYGTFEQITKSPI